MKKTHLLVLMLLIAISACTQKKENTSDTARQAGEADQEKGGEEMKEISPADYTTFKVSDSVAMYGVSFKNQYKMNIVGHLFIRKDLDQKQKHRAIIVGHPMGAVKEQAADVYASKMAEKGFITLAVDLAFWGESEGEPRNAVSPDMYSETFSAAVDFLGTRPFIDRNNIGIIGICGSGSFAISAAKVDPRLKAVATVSMYDMGSVTRNGLKKSQSLTQRKEMLVTAAEQRYQEYTTGEQIWINYLPKELSADTDSIRREFFDFYRTPRGIHIPKGRTLEQTLNRTLSGETKFVNFYPFNDIETISPRPLLFITGDHAHSREFSEDAYKRAAQPKELLIVPNAGHVDLYDRVELIPFDRLEKFFAQYLK
ncbi:alpha/beta hydrolase [Flavobacterium aquicola]|uniref:Dienelactone hydrolase domain-containing protein n=1 Tax=Flavobacterium aquicola TaxID=1682742 RepID=A0A3E0EMS0_9FLAO|nr:alpha/beta hydrolase [Flavobacterium aquicola]REG99478.1 hypothetical protein C8P67_10496 [Flavobacterium aquicola]